MRVHLDEKGRLALAPRSALPRSQPASAHQGWLPSHSSCSPQGQAQLPRQPACTAALCHGAPLLGFQQRHASQRAKRSQRQQGSPAWHPEQWSAPIPHMPGWRGWAAGAATGPHPTPAGSGAGRLSLAFSQLQVQPAPCAVWEGQVAPHGSPRTQNTAALPAAAEHTAA